MWYQQIAHATYVGPMCTMWVPTNCPCNLCRPYVHNVGTNKLPNLCSPNLHNVSTNKLPMQPM